MPEAKNDDTVQVHYVGRYPGGKVIDTPMEKEAIAQTSNRKAGTISLLSSSSDTRQVIKGFNIAVLGMKPSVEKTVTV